MRRKQRRQASRPVLQIGRGMMMRSVTSKELRWRASSLAHPKRARERGAEAIWSGRFVFGLGGLPAVRRLTLSATPNSAWSSSELIERRLRRRHLQAIWRFPHARGVRAAMFKVGNLGTIREQFGDFPMTRRTFCACFVGSTYFPFLNSSAAYPPQFTPRCSHSHSIEIPAGARILSIAGQAGIRPDGTLVEGFEA